MYGRFSEVCVCVCVLRNWLVNALVIVNVSAFQSGFLFLLHFYCKCMGFCVDVSYLRVNISTVCPEFFVCLSTFAYCKCMGFSGFLFRLFAVL